MIRHLALFILLTGLLLPLSIPAQDNEVKAGVSLSVEKEGEFWAGQQVTLNLDLKTTGFSFSNSHFNLPEVDGAFLMQTDTTTIKLTERVDGRDWQVVRYPLALYPQSAGQLEVPPINVRFTTSAGFGSEEKAFEFQTNPLALNIMLPPGAKPGELVVTTTSFELEHDWQPSSGAKKTGDAVTLTVKRRAGDISAMLLPTLPVFRTEGLASYPQTPEVNDRTDRGDLTGVRNDSITWVVEKPGTYEIPGIRFQWWDPVNRELKQQIVPGLVLDIPESAEESTATASVQDDVRDSARFWPVLVLSLTGLLAAILWFRYRRKTLENEASSEKMAFTELQKACKSNNASNAHSAIHNWIAFLEFAGEVNSRPPTLTGFARKLDNKHLIIEFTQLQEALVSPDSGWQGGNLLAALESARNSINHQDIDRTAIKLAPLNP